MSPGGGVPLGEAVLCLDCEAIRSARRGLACPSCGSESAWPVAAWLSDARPQRRGPLREIVRAKLAAARASRRRVAPVPAPLYDEVYAEGTAWLDRL